MTARWHNQSDVIIINKALGRENIDEVIKLSEEIQEDSQLPATSTQLSNSKKAELTIQALNILEEIDVIGTREQKSVKFQADPIRDTGSQHSRVQKIDQVMSALQFKPTNGLAGDCKNKSCSESQLTVYETESQSHASDGYQDSEVCDLNSPSMRWYI